MTTSSILYIKKSFLVLVLGLTLSYTISAQTENLQFTLITPQDGLPDNMATAIVQDSKGFIWVGTARGLSRYDGHSFKNFMHDPQDSSTIASNMIYGIMEDKSEDLWVNTTVGLVKFNRKKESFHHIPHGHLLGKEGDHTIIAMAPGKAGKLWLATWSGFILQLDIKTENLAVVELEIEIGDPIIDFYEDKNGLVWVATRSKGLYTFDTKEGFRFIKQYRSDDGDGYSLSSDSLSFIHEDNEGAMWVGSFNGLSRISPERPRGKNVKIERFYHQENNTNSLAHNFVHGIREDNTGILWIRTAEGINTYNRETRQFKKAFSHPFMNVVSYESFFWTHALIIDNAGSIWFSGALGGLVHCSSHKNKFEHITYDPQDENGLNTNGISSFLQDSSGVLWVGAWNEGLTKRVPGKNSQEASWYHYRHDPNDPTSIGSDQIHSIYRDSRGVLWIATVGGGDEQTHRSGKWQGSI